VTALSSRAVRGLRWRSSLATLLLLSAISSTAACRAYLKRVPPPDLPASQPRPSTGPPPKATLHFALARMARLEGDLDRAREHINIALLFDSDAASLHLERSRVARLQGDPDTALASLSRALAHQPDHLAARRELAGLLQSLGQLEQAVPHLEAILERGQDDQATVDLLRIQLGLGHSELARTRMDAWVLRDPDPPQLLHERAMLRLRLGDAEGAWDDLAVLLEAHDSPGRATDLFLSVADQTRRYRSTLELLQHLARWSPGDEELLVRLAGLAERVGHSFLAAEAWAALDLVRGHQDPDVQLMLARAQLACGEPELALQQLDLAQAADPELPGLRLDRARALFAAGATDQALTLLATQPEQPLDATAALVRASLLDELGREDEAREQLRAALDHSPQRADLAWQLASLEASLGRLSAALAIHEAHRGAARSGVRHEAERAQLYALAGEVERALVLLEAAEQAYPQQLIPVRERITLLHDSGRADEALAAAERARERLPGDPGLLRLQAWLCQQTGDSGCARRALETGLAEHPDDASLLNDLAWLRLESGESSDDLLAMAGRAVQQEPANPAFLDTYGWLLLARGEVQRALAELEAASRFDPDNETIAAHLDQARAAAARSPPPASGEETRYKAEPAARGSY